MSLASLANSCCLPSSKMALLRDRAQMLRCSRRFFDERGLLEVDTPLLCRYPCVDAHIDLFHVETNEGRRWLHSSPEYVMKRLLCEGMSDIYQISHVFRFGEAGRWHNPEFTMVEWYRNHRDLELLIAEVADFISLFLGERSVAIYPYHALFARYVGIDLESCSYQELVDLLIDKEPQLAPSLADGSWQRDALLQLLMHQLIEPHLGSNEYSIVVDWPATQAALAQVVPSEHYDCSVAKRFELFADGIELANGYLELRDPEEHRRRWVMANELKVADGKLPLPLDEPFLELLAEKELPECCGVAVGFDRLMMMRHRVDSIERILPYSWRQV